MESVPSFAPCPRVNSSTAPFLGGTAIFQWLPIGPMEVFLRALKRSVQALFGVSERYC